MQTIKKLLYRLRLRPFAQSVPVLPSKLAQNGAQKPGHPVAFDDLLRAMGCDL